jgi:hypothetical protein
MTDIDLPKGILKSDLKYPTDYKDHSYSDDFELWYTERFGWCIPTLLIAKARRGAKVPDRTYAVTLTNKETICVGRGPHVKSIVKVYVKKSRVSALQSFLDIKNSGECKAGEIRDSISTRRMNSMQRRHSGGWY